MTETSLSYVNSRAVGTILSRCLLLLGICLAASPALRPADPPEWLAAAARTDIGDFGRGSAAVVVHDWREFRVDAAGRFTSVERRALRILNLRAAQPYLRAYGEENSTESVVSIRGWSLSRAGKLIESGKNEIVSRANFADFELYSDSRSKSVMIPGVEEGGLAGYEITRQGKLLLGADRFAMEGGIPVWSSELTVSVASGSLHWFVNYPDRVHVTRASPTELALRAERRPAIVYENSTPAFSSLAAIVFLNFPLSGAPAIQSWDAAAQSYHPLYRNAERSDQNIVREVEKAVAGKTTDLARIDALYDFVSRQIRYVAIEIGIGGYQPHPAPDVYRSRYGDCKDKATLLITMLSAVGLKAYPALIGTRGSIEVEPAAPTLATFNHMIVAFPVPPEMRAEAARFAAYDAENHILWMDPTSDADALGQLPEMDQGVFALITYPDRGQLRRTPEIAAERNAVTYTARLVLNAQGQGTADVQVKYSGNENAGAHARYRERSQSELRQIFERRVTRFVDSATLTAASIFGVTDNRQDVRENFSFTGNFATAGSGGGWFLQPLFLSGLSVPELGGRPRVHVLDIGSPYSIRYVYSIVLPLGMQVSALPEAIVADSEFGKLQTEYSFDGGVLSATQIISFTASRIPPGKYADFRDFVNRGLRLGRQRLLVGSQ